MSNLPPGAVRVLDHGFIRLVDIMGNDDAIAEAARVSYGRGTKSSTSTRGLVRSLMRRGHTSPFEMIEVKTHVKLPIFVARQWIRHRTANVNEVSARYSIISDDAYVPSVGAIQGQSKTDKQGRDGQVVGDPLKFRSGLIDRGYFGRQAYDDAIEAGVSRELARLHQTVAGYTEWYWKIDLHNLFHFLRLRLDHHAQYEIRVYAEAILELIRPLLPIAVGAFEDYRLGAVTFSAAELVCIGDMLAGLNPVYDGMSKTERREFDAKIAKAKRA